MNPQHPQSTIDTGKPTSPPQRTPYAKLVSVTAACGVILVLSVWLMDFSPDMPWRALIALLPMLAMGLFLWLLIGLIRSTDERIQRIETGRYDPSLPLAFRIARLFSLRIEEIFFPENASGE